MLVLRAGSDPYHGCAADWKELNPTPHDCSSVWALSTLEQPGPVAGWWFSILNPGLDKQNQETETGRGCWHPGCSLDPCVWTNALEGMRAPESTPEAEVPNTSWPAGWSPLCAPLWLNSRWELRMFPLCSAEWPCGLCCHPGWAERSAVWRETCCIRHNWAGPT